MKSNHILGLITARGGSKGVYNKNIKLLAGKPLLAYTVEEALKSQKLTRVVLSSEDKEIIKVAQNYDIEVPYLRPKKLAEDETPSLLVVKDLVKYLIIKENYEPDIIVLLQPTSPLRKSNHIDEAISLFEKNNADSLVSVVEIPHNYSPYSAMQLRDGYLKPFLDYDEENNLRQKKPTFFARNGAAIYIFTLNCLMEKNSLYGDKILPYLMDQKFSIDIDTEWDFEIAEKIIKGMSDENTVPTH